MLETKTKHTLLLGRIAVVLMCAFALLVAGCSSSQEEPAAQEEQTYAEETASTAAEDKAVDEIDLAEIILESEGTEEGEIDAERTRAWQVSGAEEGTLAGNVVEIDQLSELPAGCEIVSLSSVLNAMGYAVNAERMVNQYVSQEGSEGDFVSAYAGNPYQEGWGYPPAIISAGNTYLEAKDSSYRFADDMGLSFDEVADIANSGTPMLVWTTMYMGEPLYTDRSQNGYRLYTNEHCVVVVAVDDESVVVMDPLEGFVGRDREEFASLYVACGRMAVGLERVS